jgi:hypothetical protein
VSAVRDVLAQWLLFLIPWAAFGVSGVALVWIGIRIGTERALSRCWCASSETVVILPGQREASQ